MHGVIAAEMLSWSDAVDVHVKSLGMQCSVITASEGCNTDMVKAQTTARARHGHCLALEMWNNVNCSVHKLYHFALNYLYEDLTNILGSSSIFRHDRHNERLSSEALGHYLNSDRRLLPLRHSLDTIKQHKLMTYYTYALLKIRIGSNETKQTSANYYLRLVASRDWY